MYDGIEDVIRFMPEVSPKKEIRTIPIEWEVDMILIGTHQPGHFTASSG
jgi:nucleotide-binding universal stress UspA family protein